MEILTRKLSLSRHNLGVAGGNSLSRTICVCGTDPADNRTTKNIEVDKHTYFHRQRRYFHRMNILHTITQITHAFIDHILS